MSASQKLFSDRLASLSEKGRVALIGTPGKDSYLVQFSFDGHEVKAQAWSKTLETAVNKLYYRCMDLGVFT